MHGPILKKLLIVALVASTAACVWISRRVDVRSLDVRDGVEVRSPVKAHLKDGSTIVYEFGVTVSSGVLHGKGLRYDLTLINSTTVDNVPLDSVIGMESFRTRVNGAQTFLVSTLASAGAFIGSVALAVAIFGSCPTVYSGDGAVEEAELFSSSIAPLFEGRDVDRLRAQPDAAGSVTLELRNEAMETHYINHLQLLEVQHTSDEVVVPDAQGAPVAVRGVRTVAATTSRSGRDVSHALVAADGIAYSTDRRDLDRATVADMDDWIDITAPVAAGSDTTVLVFRLRNSLLNTVLLYDVMLGSTGAGALDWLGTGLTHIPISVELGRWHQRRAGLHILVWQNGSYREVARVPDSGPISWHDVAVEIPVPAGEHALRARLSFVADHWRIDRVAIADAARVATVRAIPIAEVTGPGGAIEAEAREQLRAPDERYLQTNPGQRFFARFDAGASPAARSRTFLLSSQGYYTEWIRGGWIRQASRTEPFVPNDGAILTALRTWAATREEFERRFLTARVPVN